MKSQNIEYKILSTRAQDVAKDEELNQYFNQKIADGKYMIGFEVTQFYFQSKLNKSIDPQHTDNTTKRTDTSAIDHVLNNIDSLSNELNGKDICMLTTKADLDSVGAMAILTMGLEGRLSEIKTLEVKQRVEEVNKYDNFTLASKWQPMAIKDSIETNKQFGAINTAVIDFKISLNYRVEIMKEWLKNGTQPEKYVLAHEKEITEINQSIENGSTTITLKSGVAIVKSYQFKALQIGYSKAPGVIAYNPEFKLPGEQVTQLKFSISQFPGEKVFNLNKIKVTLNTKDPFVSIPSNIWGGPANLLASPISTGTGLSAEDVIDIVLSGIDETYIFPDIQ